MSDYVNRGQSWIKGYSPGGVIQQKMQERHAADRFRQTDPVERAKTFLRRKGFTCYAAWVIRGPADKTVVGSPDRILSDKELLAFAAERGFEE